MYVIATVQRLVTTGVLWVPLIGCCNFPLPSSYYCHPCHNDFREKCITSTGPLPKMIQFRQCCLQRFQVQGGTGDYSSVVMRWPCDEHRYLSFHVMDFVDCRLELKRAIHTLCTACMNSFFFTEA